MKKFLLWLLMVLVLIGALVAGTGYYFYRSVSPEDVPQPALSVGDLTAFPTAGTFSVPVMGGVLFRQIDWVADSAQSVTAEDGSLPITAPAEADSVTVEIFEGSRTLFSGALSEYANFSFSENGSYRALVTATFFAAQPGERPRAYGTLQYEFTIKVAARLAATLSKEVAVQGEVVAVRVTGNLGEIAPVARLGEDRTLPFFKRDGVYTALIALPHNQETGDYTVTVQVGGETFQLPLSVQYVPYEKHTFATAAELPDAGEDESAGAVEEYRTAVWPLYDTVADTALWQGKFTPPVTGTLLYDYGTGSLLPGQTVSTRHSGIDYQVSGLTAAVATNSGQVVFSGQLRLTGNTVILEHGGGLKSYLYFLDTRTVSTGDTVERGQTVGTVAAGGTVHFEMRVGSRTVDPAPLLDGTSSIFN